MGSLLEVDQLKIQFDLPAGVVRAVRGISFKLEPGKVLAIVGESGSGKSVTAFSIMGLISTPPGKITGGLIRFNGEELLLKTEKQMQKIRGDTIAMIFQDPLTYLNPVLTIETQITEGLRLHRGMNAHEARRRVIGLLYRVGLPGPEGFLKRYPHQCSGGMRQRVMIAMALACEPKLLIADEPTAALDATIQAQILELFRDIKEDHRPAIILITHDFGVVAGLADRILVMYAGNGVEAGPAEKVLTGPIHPYTRGLLRSVPRMNMGPGDRLVPVRGRPPDLLLLPFEQCPFLARCDYALRICSQAAPPFFEVRGSHRVRCWLRHPLAPQINFPEGC